MASTPEGGLSEFELIEAMRERIARAGASDHPDLRVGSGDDAAVVERSGATATSVDALVEGVHFRIPPFSLREVGAKALAVALSDLAAMGAEPGEAYVQLGLPQRYDEAALELADGVGELAARHALAVAGGDVTRSPVLFLAVTAVGTAPAAATLVRRAGAEPGDLIAVSGCLGEARAGLLADERPDLAEGLDKAVAQRLRHRQHSPQPLLMLGRELAASGARAMIDLSDGLAGDARHLAAASGVKLVVELDRLPVGRGVAEVSAAAGVEADLFALGGGEDYELLVALPSECLGAAAEGALRAGTTLTVIGEVAAGAGTEFRRRGGERVAAESFDQLRPRQAPLDPA